MTNHRNASYAQTFDCGDGVPALSLLDDAKSNLDVELEQMLERTEPAGATNADANVIDADRTKPNKPDANATDASETDASETDASESHASGVNPAAAAQAGESAIEFTGLTVSTRTTVVSATVVMQLVIALAVILGLNPVVGGLAAFAVMAAGVGLAFVGVVRTTE